MGHAVVRRHGPQRPGGRRHAGARLALGLLLQTGIGCEMSQALAVNHFRAAAMAGDAVAMNCLAAPSRRASPRSTSPTRRRRLVPQGRRGGASCRRSRTTGALMQGKGVPRDEGRRRLVRARGRPGRPRRAELARALDQDGRCGVLIDDAEAAVVHARGGLGQPTRRPSRRHGKEGGRREGHEKAPPTHGAAADADSQAALDEPQPRPTAGAGAPFPKTQPRTAPETAQHTPLAHDAAGLCSAPACRTWQQGEVVGPLRRVASRPARAGCRRLVRAWSPRRGRPGSWRCGRASGRARAAV